jgi:UDP-N-acetylmuramoyl-tripeptide--D-alanyl-D-alanine ligase
MDKRQYRKFISWLLKPLIKAVLKKYKPRVIGITGSVGKTSAKEAIFAVLKNKYSVYRNAKNFNNELGLPLTILGLEKSGGKNIFSWLGIILKACNLLLFTNKKYPQVLVLEMGADRPGDIKYLTSMAKPDIAVITTIGQSHIEYFGSIENIAKEKISITDSLGKEDFIIINGDDPFLQSVAKNKKTPVRTFGQGASCDIKISKVGLVYHRETFGTNFKLNYQGAEMPIFLPNILGSQHAMAAAAACAVALVMGLNLVEAAANIQDYQPALGRTKLLPGVKNSWLIDDTYNSSPQSSKVALEILNQMPSEGRKIAVLGDMLELGAQSESEHNLIGKLVFDLKIDYLFVVGERSRDIARGAIEAGMSEDKIFHFPKTFEAGTFLQERLKPSDVVLIKGSRGMKMEQVVYELMARPWDANEYLVAVVKK